ncbi:heparinase II/III domain-containing protein [Rugamonas fusca]|nr:heparinase II/III family protein [Rugamonas fusca]
MKPFKSQFLSAFALMLAAVSAPSYADWAQSIYPNYTPPRPASGQVQAQNPPAFTWSKYPYDPSLYIVKIMSGTTVVGTYTVSRSFYLPAAPLPAGTYTWQVTPAGTLSTGAPAPTVWSDPRTFTVDATATMFVVPSDASLASTIQARARPRQLPSNFTPVSGWSTAMHTARDAALSSLQTEVTGRITSLATLSDSLWPLAISSPLTSAMVAQQNDVRTRIGLASRQLEASALLYRLTGNTTYLNEAFRRGDELTKLSPLGPTSYTNQDQATRQITLALLKAYDFLKPEIEAADAATPTLQRKLTWMNAVNARMVDIYGDLARNSFRLDQAPYDSHGSTLLGYAAAISTLALGEPNMPNAMTWFTGSFRAYVNWVSIWAGPEGGFADGTAYGQYSLDYSLQLWQPLKQATGIDLFSKPWSLGLSKFFMHFQPPGAPGHVFGDEHDVLTQPTLMKAFASRFSTPYAAWYVSRLNGSTENAVTLLEAEYPLPVTKATSMAAPPNGALYPSIGWAAMLSDINNTNRTAVYFKSSPYGSYNHSHLDQNSLVIDSGGKRLLTEAGYSDYYYSPLAVSWFRTTKAKNAITFDGGVGQVANSDGWRNLLNNGKITAFSTSSTLDYVEGDATAAYNSSLVSTPTLTQAVRKVWYLRDQDVVLVVDKLNAPLPHTYEWNLHSMYSTASATAGTSSFTTSGLKVRINNEGRTLCLNSLSTDVALQPRTGAPSKTGITENHMAYTKLAPATAGEFIVVASVGCRNTSATISTTSSGRTVTLVSTSPTGAVLTRSILIGN